MKWMALLILWESCLAMHAVAEDWRLVGTNLYDFTLAGPAYHLGGPTTQIVKVWPKSVQVEVAYSKPVFVPDPDMMRNGGLDPVATRYWVVQWVRSRRAGREGAENGARGGRAPQGGFGIRVGRDAMQDVLGRSLRGLKAARLPS